MAVQAQYPSSNGFSLNFQIERAAGNNVPEDHCQVVNLIGGYNNTTTNSEFAAYNNAAGSSKKRVRDEGADQHKMFFPQQSKYPQQQLMMMTTPTPISTGLQLSSCLQNQNHEQNRAQCSAGTSTSGASKFIQRHNSEIDSLLRLHNDKIRLGIEEIHKRHYKKLISAVGKRFTNVLKEKDAELEMAMKKKAELEARLSQITAENQIWFNFARNSETVACALKANLDSVIRRGAAVERHVAEDAGSCCDGGDDDILLRRRGSPKCRSCRERDVSVLMLPCRHLCLCKECEPESDTCPICNAKKNGSVEVFME